MTSNSTERFVKQVTKGLNGHTHIPFTGFFQCFFPSEEEAEEAERRILNGVQLGGKIVAQKIGTTVQAHVLLTD